MQRRLTHYRVPFFEMLRGDLHAAGLDLRLAYGAPTTEEASKKDGAELAWGTKLATTYWWGGKLCWQPFSAHARTAAVTVITAENKLLCNLAEQYLARSRRVMLWGHGANLQGKRGSLRERFKSRVAMQADWWLAYTDLSRDLVAAQGFPPDRITVLDNSVDTAELRSQFAAVTSDQLAQMRADLGMGTGPVGIFLGSLYAEKRIEFLLEAARAIRRQLPTFELLIVGTGPLDGVVRAAAQQSPWIKVLGLRKGAQKALVASLADVMLNPGLVGLNILDSFAGGLPMITTDCGLHSPEIAYLKPGVNGAITADDMHAYVEACIELLCNEDLRARLKTNCLADAGHYTLEHMSRQFTQGVVAALEAPIRRGRR